MVGHAAPDGGVESRAAGSYGACEERHGNDGRVRTIESQPWPQVLDEASGT